MVAAKSQSAGKKRSRNSNTRDVEEEEEEEEEVVGSGSDDDDEEASGSNKKGKGKGKKATQSKGKGKKKALEQSDEEEGSGGEDEDGDTGKKGALTTDERIQLVQSITRYVLFCEYTRKPIRREDITKMFLTADKRGKHFPDLILRAQKNLRSVFGMELVLMRTKEGVKNPAKTFALRSTLPIALVKASVNSSYPELVDEAGPALTGMKGIWKEVAEYQSGDGDIMRDSKKEQSASYGILGVILGLILVNNKVLGDDQLVSYLRRLGLEHDSFIPTNISSAHPSLTVSAYLTLLIRQSYLEKSKTAGGAKQTAGQVKGAGEVGVEWKWGARAEIEIGETGIAKFLQVIFDGETNNNRDIDEGDEEEIEIVGGVADKARKAKAVKFIQEIKRASGVKVLASPAHVDALEAAGN